MKATRGRLADCGLQSAKPETALPDHVTRSVSRRTVRHTRHECPRFAPPPPLLVVAASVANNAFYDVSSSLNMLYILYFYSGNYSKRIIFAAAVYVQGPSVGESNEDGNSFPGCIDPKPLKFPTGALHCHSVWYWDASQPSALGEHGISY